MIILQHTHMARAVCSLPPKRKRKDILRSFLQYAVFYVLTEYRIEWRTASHEKTSINASSSLQIQVRCRIKVYRVFYVKKRNYDVEVGKLCAIRSLYQPALTLPVPHMYSTVGFRPGLYYCTVQYYYGTGSLLPTTHHYHGIRIVYHTGQCCTALQYYSRYVVTSGVPVLYYRCVGTGNTLQLVRLKLAPHDYLSSSEFTNFDVIVSFFNVEKTVYFYTATLK
jgi:hypothetical protein